MSTIQQRARYVVAIDLGTSGTAFAYHAMPDATAGGAQPTLSTVDTRLTVYAPGRRVRENEGKAPTAVCLDARTLALESVGTDAFDDWTRAEEEGLAESKLLFSEFKLLLAPTAQAAGVDRGDPASFRVHAAGGPSGAAGGGAGAGAARRRSASYQLLIPVARLLEGVKGMILRHLQAADTTMGAGDIAWALTVPAIWDEEGKAFMRRAAELGGLLREDGSDADRLAIVLEPEAAAISALASMEPAEAARVVPGTKLMILDCGGGTIDITSSVVRRFEGTDVQLDELQLPGGGPWGGTDVDKRFLAFLSAFVLAPPHAPPPPAGSKPARLSKDTWIRVRSSWLAGKEQFDHRDEARLTEVDLTDVAPVELLEDSADAQARIAHINERIARGVAYAGSLVARIGRSTNLRLRLRLSPQAMLAFFEPSISRTISEAQRMLAVPDAADTGLLLVVGGYAQSDLLFDALREALSSPSLRVVRPTDAWKAVVRGAVLFGLSPTAFVTSRRIRSNFGVVTSTSINLESYDTFAKTQPNPDSYYSRFLTRGTPYIRDIVDELVRSGSNVRSDEPVTRKYWGFPTQKQCIIPLVRTPRSLERVGGRMPRLVTDDADDGVSVPRSHIASEVAISFPNTLLSGEDKAMEVRLFFGRSEIMAEVITVTTGARTRVPLRYNAPRPLHAVATTTNEDDDDSGDEAVGGASGSGGGSGGSGSAAPPRPGLLKPFQPAVRAAAGAGSSPPSPAPAARRPAAAARSREAQQQWEPVAPNQQFGGILGVKPVVAPQSVGSAGRGRGRGRGGTGGAPGSGGT